MAVDYPQWQKKASLTGGSGVQYLTKQQWMDYLSLRQDQLPEGLIVLGRWGVGSALATFGELADGVTPVTHLENVVLAQSGAQQNFDRAVALGVDPAALKNVIQE